MLHQVVWRWLLRRRRIMQLLFRVFVSLIFFVIIVSFYSSRKAGLAKACSKDSRGNEICINPSTTSRFLAISTVRIAATTVTFDNKGYEYKEESGARKVDDSLSLNTVVHLSVVACGERLEETLMMLKSAVIFGEAPIHAHIFADDQLRPMFNESDLLKELDSVLYVDTDILFLRPPETVWRHFSRFNSSHLAACAPESEDSQTNWYVRFSRHPFVPPLGINSGVMLMNMTRMRKFNWGSFMWPLYTKYRYNVTWGDQDIINIIFHNNTDKLYVYGCEWNYRPDHCMYMSTCEKAEQLGAYVLHGSRSYFHIDKQPAFKAVYEAFKVYKFGKPLDENLVTPLESKLKKMDKTTNCAQVHWIFTRQLRKYVNKIGKNIAQKQQISKKT